ncbi:MAG TPA: M20/M25/M40 family metallo-hydrolase, partial [Chitinophagaceae bacterium]|nr:M20/M25/M40 family metallo-hydrolase [Chitinophagaceae bacterium]
GEGAHDDGAGCVQSIEVLRTFKQLGIRPKHTIRAVLFMNEENGLKGGVAYADSAKARKEHHIFALESDAGGFAPRGIETTMDKKQRDKFKKYAPLFLPYGIYNFDEDGGGADVSPLKKQGVVIGELLPDSQRYFDLHHTDADVFEAVNHRELKLGAAAMAMMIYIVDQKHIVE